MFSNWKSDDETLRITTLVSVNRAIQRKDSCSSGNRRNSFLTASVIFH
ncbi:hypothetical protein ACFP3I_16315 [Chryseobacterium arachidis]